MRPRLARRTAAALACSVILGAPNLVQAQPAPSLRAACADLRAGVQSLDLDPEKLVTIQVVGTLTAVQTDGALAYLAMCAPPEPQVLCLTYTAGERRIGDRVVLSGAVTRPGPNHILLDPCLHSPPE